MLKVFIAQLFLIGLIQNTCLFAKENLELKRLPDYHTDTKLNEIIKKNSTLWESLKSFNPKEEKEINIIVVSYNNKDWYKDNLDSIFSQKYNNYHVMYVDDASTDGTPDLVEQYAKEKKIENKITLFRNKDRCGSLANTVFPIHLCPNNKIIALLDGDDKFAHENVLSLINKVYQNDNNIWMTYGQFVDTNYAIGFCHEPPNEIIQKNSFREYPIFFSHVRTFYAWLFKLIKPKDFIFEGRFFSAAPDLAFMLPMLEMAGNRIKFIPDITYIYNRVTPFNEYKIYTELVLFLGNTIMRNKEKYAPIPHKFSQKGR